MGLPLLIRRRKALKPQFNTNSKQRLDPRHGLRREMSASTYRGRKRWTRPRASAKACPGSSCSADAKTGLPTPQTRPLERNGVPGCHSPRNASQTLHLLVKCTGCNFFSQAIIINSNAASMSIPGTVNLCYSKYDLYRAGERGGGGRCQKPL